MIWRQKLAWLKTWPGLHHLTSVTLDGGGWEYDVAGTDVVERLERVEPGDDKDHAWYFRKLCADMARPLLHKAFARGRLAVEGRRVADRGPTGFGLDGGREPAAVVADEQGAVDLEAAKDWLSELGPGLRCKR